MKITVLKYGETVFGENYIFKDGCADKMSPITFTFYLIETNDKKILVDVGCNDGAGFPMSVFTTPQEVLNDYGLDVDDITDIIITHAHHDHIAAIASYKSATIHIQEMEYECGKGYIPQDMLVHTFADSFQITEHILVKKIGGHTTGSSVVICSCDDKDYVLCGDECYVKKCLEKQIPSGNNYNQEISMDFVKEYSKDKYIPLLFHDPEILKGKIGFDIVLHKEN